MNLPQNWRFREILINNQSQLILEYKNKYNIWLKQHTFKILNDFKIGDEIINYQTNEKAIITNMIPKKIFIKKGRFELILEEDEWYKWDKN